ncbi:hypothetical protein [Neobacillus sp.]|nr:hypothetical protein [Neobacillus sp.]
MLNLFVKTEIQNTWLRRLHEHERKFKNNALSMRLLIRPLRLSIKP